MTSIFYPELFEFISHYIEEHGWPPTRRELVEELEFSSTSVVHSRLQELAQQGLITIEPRKARGIRICQ